MTSTGVYAGSVTAWRAKRIHLLLLLTAAAFGGSVFRAAPAAAHAIVEDTAPGIDEVVEEPPERVVMRFNEPVEVAFGAIRVYDTDARRVDLGTTEHLPGAPDAIQTRLRGDLAAGTYTVTWRVVSADGHAIQEAFVFHVGKPGENPEGIADSVLTGDSAGRLEGVAYGAVRWVNFAGLLLLAGGAMFRVLVWNRGAERRDRPPEVQAIFDARWSRFMTSSWAAVLLATLASLVLQAAVAGGLSLTEAASTAALEEVLRTRFGLVAVVKLALLIAGFGLWWFVVRRTLRHSASRSLGAAARQVPTTVGTIVGVGVVVVGLLATPGLAGHAGTTPPVALNVAADTVHLIAAAAWLGGLILLLRGAFPAASVRAERDAVATLAPLVGRFSDIAVVAVGAIVATGVYRAWIEVNAWRALTGAPYGWVLLAKLAAFVPLLALGGINNRWSKPRLAAAAGAGEASAGAMRLLRRTLTAEVALIAVVLAMSALLVNLPPARVEAGVTGPLVTDVRLGTYNLNVLIDPNRVGANEVHLTATAPTGAPAPVKAVKVLFTMPAEDLGPLVAHGTRLAPGHFVVQGRQLSVPGEWVLEVVARTGRFDEERTRLQIDVNG